MGEIKDISKQPLVIWQGQTVITTAQLAEVYGATADNISDNFNRNKDRFTVGKHYILLEGNELREFKNYSAESGLVSKNARQLYLWTRRGASRHCKILGTDKAWEQFDYLEENYFDRQSSKQQTPLTLQQQIQTIAQGTAELYERVDNLAERIDKVENDLPILPLETDRITEAARRKGVTVLGGKKSPAYQNRGLRQKIYNNLYSNLKYNFGVKSYRAIKRVQADMAVEIIQRYEPPFFLQVEIDNANAQMTLDLEGARRYEQIRRKEAARTHHSNRGRDADR